VIEPGTFQIQSTNQALAALYSGQKNNTKT
jgi:hypothetical protein